MADQNIEIVKLQIRKGPEAQLPVLDAGEPAMTTDTNKIFIGDGATNHEVAKLGDLSTVATSGHYNDLAGKPTLSTVATSGSYSDLAGKPNLSAVAVSGNYTDLAGKPALSPVATSGNYTDLAGTPAPYSLPVATNSVLGGVKQGKGVSFDADGTLNAGAGITSATMMSGLEADLPTVPIGQYYFCTDSYKVYFGTPVGNLYLGTATVATPPVNTGGGTTATPTVVFSDDFTRADSAVSPGTSDSYAGGTNTAWVVDSGTFGISANQLYTPNTTACRTHINAGVSDAKMEVTVAVVGNEHDFYFRQDTTNSAFYLRYAYNSTGWYLQEGGATFTTIKSFPGTIANGDVIALDCSGSTVTLSKNGTVIDTSTALTDLQTNTGFGVGFSGSSAGRYDNFKITSSSIPSTGGGDTTPPVLTVTPSANTTFTGTQSVTMSATDANGATIYYTTDGSDPKTSGTKQTYSAALSLSATTTVRAFAQDPSGNQSATQTIVFTLSGATSTRPTNYLTATAPNGTDDTSALQSTINSAASQGKAVILPSGNYKINIDVGLNLPSNTTLWFDSGAQLSALASSAGSGTVTKIINVLNASNVNIIGYPKLIGDWKIHTGTTVYPAGQEYGMGIYARSTTNFYVENANISWCDGDGIYLGNGGGSQTYCSNTTLKNVVCDSNSRNGISVISADGLTITSPTLTNNVGTLPKCGIDFEPNLSTERLANVTMTDPYIQNNGAEGIHFWMKNLGSYPISVTITNMTNVKNNANGSVYYGGTTSTLKGYVKIDGTYYLNQ